MGFSRPTTARGDSVSRYISEIRTYPMLSEEEEQELCCRWRDHHDVGAVHQLVGSHLRLVVKIARGHRGYGLPPEDLIGEGHVGLMRAVCRFDPDRGARFATYAVWWVRAAIQEYILHNWSLVKIGTTSSQRKLFFNLRRIRGELQEFEDGTLKSEHVSTIATMLMVPEHEIISMNQRMAGRDDSLNAPVGADRPGEWQSRLVDDTDDQETALMERQEAAQRKSLLQGALTKLSGREREIIVERHLKESPATLHDLAQHYGVSCERIRQIETQAMINLRRSLRAEIRA
jgi:RNA polymerase sigma-32 factor